MLFKKKPFFKILLGLSMAAGIIPLAIACSQGASASSDQDLLNQDLKDKVPAGASYQLKTGRTETAQSFVDKFTDANKDQHLTLFNEAIARVSDNNSQLTDAAIPALRENVKAEVTDKSVSGTSATLTFTFTLNNAPASRVLSITGFQAAPSPDLPMVNDFANDLQLISPMANPLVTTVMDKGSKPTVNSIADLNGLVSGNPFNAVTLPDGATLAFEVSDISSSGVVAIKVTVTKGAASAEANLVISGFTPTGVSALNAYFATLPADVSTLKIIAGKNQVGLPDATSAALANLVEGVNPPTAADLALFDLTITYGTLDAATQKAEITIEGKVKMPPAPTPTSVTRTYTLEGFALQADVDALSTYNATVTPPATLSLTDTPSLPQDTTLEALNAVLPQENQIPLPSNDSQIKVEVTYGPLMGTSSDTSKVTIKMTQGNALFTKEITLSGFKTIAQEDIEAVAMEKTHLDALAPYMLKSTATLPDPVTSINDLTSLNNLLVTPIEFQNNVMGAIVSAANANNDGISITITLSRGDATPATVTFDLTGFVSQLQADVNGEKERLEALNPMAKAFTAIPTNDQITTIDALNNLLTQNIATQNGVTIPVVKATRNTTNPLTLDVEITLSKGTAPNAATAVAKFAISNFVTQATVDLEKERAALAALTPTVKENTVLPMADTINDLASLNNFLTQATQVTPADTTITVTVSAALNSTSDGLVVTLTLSKDGADSVTVEYPLTGFISQADLTTIENYLNSAINVPDNFNVLQNTTELPTDITEVGLNSILDTTMHLTIPTNSALKVTYEPIANGSSKATLELTLNGAVARKTINLNRFAAQSDLNALDTFLGSINSSYMVIANQFVTPNNGTGLTELNKILSPADQIIEQLPNNVIFVIAYSPIEVGSGDNATRSSIATITVVLNNAKATKPVTLNGFISKADLDTITNYLTSLGDLQTMPNTVAAPADNNLVTLNALLSDGNKITPPQGSTLEIGYPVPAIVNGQIQATFTLTLNGATFSKDVNIGPFVAQADVTAITNYVDALQATLTVKTTTSATPSNGTSDVELRNILATSTDLPTLPTGVTMIVNYSAISTDTSTNVRSATATLLLTLNGVRVTEMITLTGFATA